MKTLRIEVSWDSDAQVYSAVSQDVPGLVLEGTSLDEVRREADLVIPELLSSIVADAIMLRFSFVTPLRPAA